MKHLLACLLTLLVSLTASAQKEQDFASTYMKMYAKGTSLTCQTIGPTMISKVLKQQASKENADMQQALKSIRSMRVVSNTKPSETSALHEKATALLKANSGRYKLYKDYDGKSLYVRKRGKVFVELILIASAGETLQIVNLTGTMNEAFLQELINT